jgi:hypothetical protein
MPDSKAHTDEYSDQESEQRFRKLVGIALKTPPKTQKAIGRKGVVAQRKKGKPEKRTT